MSDKNERIFHGEKLKKGKRVIRRKRYSIQPGTVLVYEGHKAKAKGVHNKGTRVMLETGKSVAIKNVTVNRFPGGWKQVI